MDNVNVNQNIHITFILEKFHISLNLYKSYINESLKLWNDQQIRSFDNFQVTLSVKQTSMHACSPVIIYQLLIHKSQKLLVDRAILIKNKKQFSSHSAIHTPCRQLHSVTRIELEKTCPHPWGFKSACTCPRCGA